jgi:hypothetical protein
MIFGAGWMCFVVVDAARKLLLKVNYLLGV